LLVLQIPAVPCTLSTMMDTDYAEHMDWQFVAI
jgi:hypothetical protein